jgi:hypothetical protein
MEENVNTESTYRQQFARTSKAEEYDRVQYDPRSYSEVLWQIERDQLTELVDEFRRTHESIEYLDFAAGTGRVISFMEDKVDHATGIEISSAMVERAQQKLNKGRMLCTDITVEGAEIEGRYDLITAFRFVLNAEPGLRRSGIEALAARLRDETSLLVFNNHGNLFSHKLLFWPLHKLRSRRKGYRTEGNYMTNRQARRLAQEAGLEIIRTIGCGFMSGTLARLLPVEKVAAVEKRLARWRVLRPFCVNQLYLARRAR